MGQRVVLTVAGTGCAG